MARLCSWSSPEPPGWDGVHPAMLHFGFAQPLWGVPNLPGYDPPVWCCPGCFPSRLQTGHFCLAASGYMGCAPWGRSHYLVSWSPTCFGPVSRFRALILTMPSTFLVSAVTERSLKMDLKAKSKGAPWAGAFSQGF